MDTKLILFISPLPPPYYGSAISSQTCLEILSENKNFEILNIKLNYSQTFQDVDTITFSKIVGSFGVIWTSFKYCVKFKPDLVYIMPATSSFAFVRDFSISLLMKMLNQNVIYHLRTQINDINRFKRFIYKKAFKNSKIIILGKELKNEILKYFHAQNISILPNAIPCKLLDNEYKYIEEKRRNKKCLKLLFLSNMIKSKGWPKVLEAAFYLQIKKTDFMLTFAGDWPSDKEKNEFYKLVKQYNLEENVKFVGHVNEEKKNSLLANTDILLFPTEYKLETFGRVIIEAMEYGIPVIANSIGSIPSIIEHGETGFLLKKNTANEIEEYILKISDKIILSEMGKKARQRFLDYYELKIYSKLFTNIIEINLTNY